MLHWERRHCYGNASRAMCNLEAESNGEGVWFEKRIWHQSTSIHIVRVIKVEKGFVQVEIMGDTVKESFV